MGKKKKKTASKVYRTKPAVIFLLLFLYAWVLCSHTEEISLTVLSKACWWWLVCSLHCTIFFIVTSFTFQVILNYYGQIKNKAVIFFFQVDQLKIHQATCWDNSQCNSFIWSTAYRRDKNKYMQEKMHTIHMVSLPATIKLQVLLHLT